MSRPRPRRTRAPASCPLLVPDLRPVLDLVATSSRSLLLVERESWRVLAASPAATRLLGPTGCDALQLGSETTLVTVLQSGRGRAVRAPAEGGWQTVGLRLPTGLLARLEARLQPLNLGRRCLTLIELRRPGAPTTQTDDASASGHPSEALDRLAQIAAVVDAILWEAEAATLRFTYVSERAETILGYPLHRWLQEPDFWPRILHPEDRERTLALCRAATDAGRDHVLEYRVLAADGRVVWLRDLVRVVSGPDSRPALLRGAMVDVTERKAAEAALQASEARFRALVQRASDMVLVLDAAGRLRYVSPSVTRLLGHDAADVLGADAFGFVHPEDRERVRASFAGVVGEPGGHPPTEFRVRHADGSWHWLEATATNLLDDPHVRGVVENLRDITERKLAEKTLRESEARYRVLMEQASDAIFVSYPGSTFIDVNAQACTLLGYTREELLTLAAHDIVAPDEFTARPPRYDDLLAGQVVRVERRLRRKDGSLVPAEVSISRLTDGRLLAIVRDVSERTRMEAALRRRDAILSAVSAAAARLLGSACWEEHAETVLAELGAAADVSRASIDQNLAAPDGNLRCLRRFRWTALGTRPVSRRLRERPFDPYALGLGRFAQLLGSGAVLQGHVRDLEPAERALLEPQGVRSLLAVPVFVDERWWGTIIFEECRQEREWSDPEVEALRLAAHLLGAAIKRAEGEAALRASEQRFRMLAENAHDVIYRLCLDPTPRLEYVSPAVERLTGYSPAALVADPRLAARVIHPHDRLLLGDMVRGKHGLTEPLVLRWLRADGSILWMEHRNTAVYDGEGRLVAIEGVARDVTEAKRYQERLHRLAYRDPLTDLPNRAFLLERLERAAGGPVAVLLLDLDRFKLVNESLGHTAGDALLVAVAERLRAAVQSDDVLARIGEDEFAVLPADASAPEGVAERLLQALAPPFTVAGRSISVTASIGIARRSAVTAASVELLRDALTALHQAKLGGRARWVLFDERVRARTVERFLLEHELRRALERDELTLAYQPIVDVSGGRIVGLEALVRWPHPERGAVPAGEIVALAEETGLIIPLGEWVLRRACRQAAEWQRLGAGTPPPIISVNLSAHQLRHPGLVASVHRVLAETALPPSALCLEITESAALDGGEAMLATLRALRELGVRLALDDFGTGYSALSYLPRLALDTLKVDRAFITDADHDSRILSIVRAIAAMAHALGMDVTAEGIETASQLTAVRAVHCDRAQGYYFSRPVSAAEVTALLQRGFLPAS